jgi:hypothetical protein
VRALIARTPPPELDAFLAANPAALPAVFRHLGTALMSPALQPAVKPYVTALAHAHAQRIPRTFSEGDVQLLVIHQVIDPLRYGEDDAFRRVVDSILPQSLPPTLPLALRRAALAELNGNAPLDFETAEKLATAAGLIKHPSRERLVDNTKVKARITTGGAEPIEASIYSINSRFVTVSQAKSFLTAVRAAAPKRRLVVVGDDAIRPAAAGLSVEFIDDFSRPLTIWPRDPFFVARAKDGGVVFINRPNLQPGREEDANMLRVLLDGLPPSLDARWKARWATGTTSFHNGQVLLTPNAAWISIHSVEFRARQLLGLDHVPAEDFGTTAGTARYAGAVQRATAELAELYARPVRFVHELPRAQPVAAQTELMTTLGGGAGFDLDSIITLLPRPGGKIEALVADLSLGRRLVKEAPPAELRELQQTYGLRGVEALPADGLQRFLDRCARDLAANGMTVRRLPLLMIPSSLLTGPRPEKSDAFLVTWNNVVLEGARAEGFASGGLRSGDRVAQAAFKAAGYDLALFPPLPRSVILNGGYRCASNEVRR